MKFGEHAMTRIGKRWVGSGGAWIWCMRVGYGVVLYDTRRRMDYLLLRE